MLGNYEEFKKEIYKLNQIDLNSYKERQMKRRIDALISKKGFASYMDFVKSIGANRESLEEFTTYLTINVSEFYRNPEQWSILEKDILPELFASKGKKLKIWSAACSTGDEPYSLVMLLSKYIPLDNIQIIATDLDLQVLEKAKSGLYHEKYLRGIPEEFVHKYFEQVDPKTYRLSEKIRRCVQFKQHDLLKDEYPKDCDLIICRNVMIYFTEEAKNIIYEKFYNSIYKNGFLFVGSTEQMIQSVKLGFLSYKSFFYRKIN